jgi:hypothetical protein
VAAPVRCGTDHLTSKTRFKMWSFTGLPPSNHLLHRYVLAAREMPAAPTGTWLARDRPSRPGLAAQDQPRTRGTRRAAGMAGVCTWVNVRIRKFRASGRKHTPWTGMRSGGSGCRRREDEENLWPHRGGGQEESSSAGHQSAVRLWSPVPHTGPPVHKPLRPNSCVRCQTCHGLVRHDG